MEGTDPNSLESKVVSSLEEMNANLNELTQHLENQFEPDSIDNSAEYHTPGRKNQVDPTRIEDIIDILNNSDDQSDSGAEEATNSLKVEESDGLASTIGSGFYSAVGNISKAFLGNLGSTAGSNPLISADDPDFNSTTSSSEGINAPGDARPQSQSKEPVTLQEGFSNKIFSLIYALQNRDDTVEDEWDNDDDAGYVTITLSEQEFFEFEDVCPSTNTLTTAH